MISDSWVLKRVGGIAYLMPVFIPPVSGKDHVMHKQVKALWQQAATALQQANRLVIAGYSCPPLDIEARISISENLHGGRLQTVHVINPVMKIADHFAGICGVDKATAYRNLEAFVEEAGG